MLYYNFNKLKNGKNAVYTCNKLNNIVFLVWTLIIVLGVLHNMKLF